MKNTSTGSVTEGGRIMCITSTYINPFTDYGFKKLFGEEGSKPQLISFINAFLELDNKAKIVDLEFKNSIPEALESRIYKYK